MLSILLALGLSAPAGEVAIPTGAPLVVAENTKIESGNFVRPPLGEGGRGGVIVLKNQKGITLDLSGVDLRGTPAGTDLDKNAGFGIVLEDCEGVTIQGGKLGGYKDCVVATRCRKLVLEDLAFDGWYGMHLRSTPAMEDESDWLFPHENDHDEWIGNYGGAIALTDCADVTIRRCKGRHGQNGILLTRTNGTTVDDCDFSFLSGWGLAMYRSSKSLVAKNLFDYCVRGYGHGVYWRGQDSAGILMFERCCDNVFALNSATHGGDGVFLYAGNDTVKGHAFDKGERDAGGSDRNVWYRNDFSCAVANAIEATFSRDNWALENDLSGSHQHGVWGGYSSRMVVHKNRIDDTLGGAVSIEHGQECVVSTNWIRGNTVGVEFWWDDNQELVQGPYGQHRDTASRDSWIIGNVFENNEKDILFKRTKHLVLGENRWSDTKRTLEGANFRIDVLIGPNGTRACGTVTDSELDGWDRKVPPPLAAATAWKCPELPGEQETSAEKRGKKGLDSIVIGEWGPWDFRSGEPKPAMRLPGGILAGCSWRSTWFSWKDGPDPRTDQRGWRDLAKHPLAEATVSAWTDPYGGDAEIRKKVGGARFGLVAATTVGVGTAGAYVLSVTSDDGVRVSIDGKVAFEDWTLHAPKRGEATVELAKGEHAVGIEYFQIDGALALAVDLARGRE